MHNFFLDPCVSWSIVQLIRLCLKFRKKRTSSILSSDLRSKPRNNNSSTMTVWIPRNSNLKHCCLRRMENSRNKQEHVVDRQLCTQRQRDVQQFKRSKIVQICCSYVRPGTEPPGFIVIQLVIVRLFILSESYLNYPELCPHNSKFSADWITEISFC